MPTAAEDRRLAAGVEVDRGRVGGAEDGPARHVGRAAVVVVGYHAERDTLADTVESLCRRADDQPLELAPGGAAGAALDPVDQEPGAVAVGGQAPAAAVAALVRRLEQNQAVLGPGQVDPTSLELTDQDVVVGGRVGTPQRQVEPAPAGRRAVAGAGVAAGTSQHRQ